MQPCLNSLFLYFDLLSLTPFTIYLLIIGVLDVRSYSYVIGLVLLQFFKCKCCLRKALFLSRLFKVFA